MECLATVKSGNYALYLCGILEGKGYVFDVVATPCQIAKSGCGYSIKFPCEDKEVLLKYAKENKVAIERLYRIIPLFSKNKYDPID